MNRIGVFKNHLSISMPRPHSLELGEHSRPPPYPQNYHSQDLPTLSAHVPTSPSMLADTDGVIKKIAFFQFF